MTATERPSRRRTPSGVSSWATLIATGVVAIELLGIARVRSRYTDTPCLAAA